MAMRSRKMKISVLALGFVVVGYLLACTMTIKIKTCQSVVEDVEQDTRRPLHEDFNDSLSLHIGVVVTNHQSCSETSLLVRSVLMYHRSHTPLHFHFITDNVSMTILETLIDSWELSFVNRSFYTLEYVANVTDLGKQFASASVDTLKLIFPVVLDHDISQIVILDANIMVATDIEILWDMFEQIKGRRSIGTLQHQPKVDLDMRILLMNLTTMRRTIWHQRYQSFIWTSARQIVSSYGLTVASKWKIETQCLDIAEGYCSDVLCEESPGTNYLAHMFSMSGDWLQPKVAAHTPTQQRTKVGDLVTNVCDWISPACLEFRREVTHRTHLFYTEYSYQSSDPYDVTMVTQLSFDRLYMFRRLLDAWDGPIGVTLYMHDSEMIELLRFIHNSSIPQRGDIAIHIVFKKGDRYPINYLRNVAWNHSNTPFVFLNDADLLPSPNMYQTLKHTIRLNFADSYHNVVFVIPAFETHIEDLPFPEDKVVLEDLMSSKDVIPFKWDYHKPAHKPTNYKKWMKITESYSVYWSEYYEPYIVVHHEATRYDERFTGYGRNKVSQIEELHAQKYAFIVMPIVFVIHYPHSASRDETEFRGFSARDKPSRNTYYYRCIRNIHDEFRKELRDKYGHSKSSYSKPILLVIVLLLLSYILGVVLRCLYVKIWGKSKDLAS